MRCGKIRLVVHRPASDDAGDARGHPHHHRVVRGLALPARGHQQVAPGAGSGGAVPDIREVVSPGADELQHVVAAGGLRHLKQDRSDAQVQLRHGVDRVVVDGHEGVLGTGQRPGVAEGVPRRGGILADAGGHIAGHLLQVEDQRESVKVGSEQFLTAWAHGSRPFRRRAGPAVRHHCPQSAPPGARAHPQSLMIGGAAPGIAARRRMRSTRSSSQAPTFLRAWPVSG